MAILDTLKEIVFRETDDPGKVCLIAWNKDHNTGIITVLVPAGAFDRASKRAILRAIRIKIPEAKSVVILDKAKTPVRYPASIYYLVRAEFTI